MPTEVLVKNDTPIVWAKSGSFSAGTHGYTRTHEIDLNALADAAARQGAKADLGAVRAARYAVRIGIEFDVAPTVDPDNSLRVYWAASSSATAATGNDGGTSGSDGAYKASEEEEWVRQLIYIGALDFTADAEPTVQIQTICPYFFPPTQYGMPVLFNDSGQALEGAADNHFIALEPIPDEIQTA